MLPLVVTVENAEGRVLRHAFAESPVRVGRSPLNDLQLDEPFVSRWQGVLRFDVNEITYFNVGATNMTRVNGVEAKVQQEIVVDGSTELSIGDLTLRFERTPVPEKDLYRRGARKPVPSEQVELATVAFEDSRRSAKAAVRRRPPAVKPPEPPPEPPPEQALSMPFGGGRIWPADSPAPWAHEREVEPHASPPPQLSRTLSPSSPPAVPSRPDPDASQAPAGLYDAYRLAWERLRSRLVKDLVQVPAAERPARVARLSAQFPEVFQEREFRGWLAQMGLGPGEEAPQPEPPAPSAEGDASLDAWFRRLSEGLMPPGFLKRGPPLGLSRVLDLLELMAASFVELHGAQESVRARWFGLASRDSLLKAAEPRVVLTYMLNPKADWDDRVRELRHAVQDLVAHELALFSATMAGAQALLNQFAPDRLAGEEGAALADAEGDRRAGRPRRGAELERQLFRRYRAMFQELADGERYQRVFLGRAFTRTYLSAMGRGSDDPPGKKR